MICEAQAEGCEAVWPHWRPTSGWQGSNMVVRRFRVSTDRRKYGHFFLPSSSHNEPLPSLLLAMAGLSLSCDDVIGGSH